MNEANRSTLNNKQDKIKSIPDRVDRFFIQKFSIRIKFFKIIGQKNLDFNRKQLTFTRFTDGTGNMLGLFKTGPNLH